MATRGGWQLYRTAQLHYVAFLNIPMHLHRNKSLHHTQHDKTKKLHALCRIIY